MTSTFTRTPRTLIEQRRNLVRNPGMRSSLDYTSRVGGTGGVGSFTLETSAPPIAGVDYGRLVVTTAPTAGSQYLEVRNNQVPAFGNNDVEAGETYTFSTWMRSDEVGNDHIYFEWLDAAGAIISTDVSPAVAGAAVWTRRSFTAVAPSGAEHVGIVIRRFATGLTVGQYLEVGGLLLEKAATVGSYFDGATPDADPIYYRWVEAANASASIVGTLAPAETTTPIQVNGYQGSRKANTVVQQIANSNDTTVTVIPAGPRSGELELLYDDVVEAMAAVALFGTGSMFDFTDDTVPEVGMTFAPAGGDIGCAQDDDRLAWLVTVPFVEFVEAA